MKAADRWKILAVISGVGFVGSIAQILLLRELLVIFLGNELSIGLALSCWLAWTTLGSLAAVGWAKRRSVGLQSIAVLLMMSACAFPAALVMCRAARLIWHVSLGEMIGPVTTLTVAASATGMICSLLGGLFALCWLRLSRGTGVEGEPQSVSVYLFEALGAGAGGLVYYFVLLPRLSALSVCLAGSSVLLLGAGWLVMFAGHGSGARFSRILWVICLATLVLMTLSQHRLQRWSELCQWGPRVIATADTAYHRLALLKDEDQLSLFADGDWWFSLPDRQTVEYGTLLPLLVHRRPRRILLLGGTFSGALQALERHPGISRIDAVEPDPGLFPLAMARFPSSAIAALKDPRLHVHLTDSLLYLRRLRGRRPYDVVLLNVGDPVNAGMNRFYTVEFFRAVRAALNTDGIFSFAVSGGESMLGTAQGEFLRSFYSTLHRVFPKVAVFPGDQTRFFAGRADCDLKLNTDLIMDRVTKRGLKLRYIRRDSLKYALSPFRLDYLNAMLSQGETGRINRDFFPVCYYRGLILWVSSWHRPLRRLFFAVSNRGSLMRRLWPLWLIVTVVLFGRLAGRRQVTRLYFNVILIGAVQMVFEILLLLSYQVIAGYVYSRIALIVAAFMFGLAIGVAVLGGSGSGGETTVDNRRRFITAQLAVAFYPVAFLIYLHGVHGNNTSGGSAPAVTACFFLFALLSGASGGFHFTAAVRFAGELTGQHGALGGRLYGLDVLGAAVGALLVGLFLLPLLGLPASLMTTSAAALAGVFLVIR